MLGGHLLLFRMLSIRPSWLEPAPRQRIGNTCSLRCDLHGGVFLSGDVHFAASLGHRGPSASNLPFEPSWYRSKILTIVLKNTFANPLLLPRLDRQSGGLTDRRIQNIQFWPGMGTIYCIHLFESA
jgi:hypothetical protein